MLDLKHSSKIGTEEFGLALIPRSRESSLVLGIRSLTSAYFLGAADAEVERIGPGASIIVPSKTDSRRLFLSTRNGLESIFYSNGRWSSEGVLNRSRRWAWTLYQQANRGNCWAAKSRLAACRGREALSAFLLPGVRYSR